MHTAGTLKKCALAFGFAGLSVCAQGFATPQCLAEFGEKNPLVNTTGWGIVGLGLLGGIALMVFVTVRARRMTWPARIAAGLGGSVAMIALSVGGLIVAVSAFFLRC